MTRLEHEYQDWLINIVVSNRYDSRITYFKLLQHLNHIEFIYIIPRDINRAYDGLELRYRFAREMHDLSIEDRLQGPCSVLEMIIALALKCEEQIMDDPKYGNRTKQWFWGMIRNLGLGRCSDDRYDERFVDIVIDTFLYRKYAKNGKGGLFTVRDERRDLRDVEIWYQLNWYLNEIT